MARICVAGLWHQASVLSACLADLGHHVRGVGPDLAAVVSLNAAVPPVREPKLASILERNLRAGRLRYTTGYAEALADAQFAFISIDTPVDEEDRSDLTPIFEAARQIARHAPAPLVVAVTAQVPVGTCSQLAGLMRSEAPGRPWRIAYVPEFLRLGTAVENFRRADRFIIGCDDAGAAGQLAALLAPLKRPILKMGLLSAEMAKHAANAFLAASISFINEVADLAAEAGADVTDVVRALKTDRRIGPHAFLSPGLGFAGGTLGREVRTLQQLGRRSGRPTALMDAVWEVNLERARFVARCLERIFGSLAGLAVGVLGLTYKPGTSTLRRSVALEIIADLAGRGTRVKAFDPLANLAEAARLPPFEMCPDPYRAAEGADAVVLITEWAGLAELDFARLRSRMRRPVFIDTRNRLEPAELERHGFLYVGVGRGGAQPRPLPQQEAA